MPANFSLRFTHVITADDQLVNMKMTNFWKSLKHAVIETGSGKNVMKSIVNKINNYYR